MRANQMSLTADITSELGSKDPRTPVSVHLPAPHKGAGSFFRQRRSKSEQTDHGCCGPIYRDLQTRHEGTWEGTVTCPRVVEPLSRPEASCLASMAGIMFPGYCRPTTDHASIGPRRESSLQPNETRIWLAHATACGSRGAMSGSRMQDPGRAVSTGSTFISTSHRRTLDSCFLRGLGPMDRSCNLSNTGGHNGSPSNPIPRLGTQPEKGETTRTTTLGTCESSRLIRKTGGCPKNTPRTNPNSAT